MIKHKKQLFTFLLVFFLLGLIIFFSLGIENKEYVIEYWFVLFSYIFVGIVFLFVISQKGAFLFEPIILIGLLFFMSYSVTPLLNILLGKTDSRGFYVMGGCITATAIYIISFISLLLGYYKKKKILSKKISWNEPETIDYHDWNKRKYIIIISYFWWFLGFIFFSIFFINNGFSIKYVLSLGLLGEANVINDISTSASGSLDFLYNFRFGMIASIIYLWRYGKQKKLYIVLYIITFMMLMTYGFRNVLVEMMIAPIVLYVILKKKIPSITSIFRIVIPIILMLSFVVTFRSSVRLGSGISSIDWTDFDFGSIYDAFIENFDLHKSFYGIVEYIPKYHSFTNGQQLLWMTITFLIPRSFWPGKPTSILDSLMVYIVGPLAVRGHTAMGTLAEYYGEFGILGCIIFCFLLGYFSSKTKSWYESKNRTEDSMIAYSVLYPMFMLLSIRGYMPLNFMHILFLEIPVISIAILKHTRIKKNILKT